MNEEVIEIGQPQQEFTEYTEVVEEVQQIDYTPVVYDCASSIISVLLFAAFAILGFFSATQIFGRTRT